LPKSLLAARWVDAKRDGGWLEIGSPEGIDLYCPGGEAPPSLKPCGALRDPRLAPTTLEPGPDLDGDGTGELVQSVFDGVAVWGRRGRETLGPAAIAPLPVRAGAGATYVNVSVTPVLEILEQPAPEVWTLPEPRPGARLRLFRVPLSAEGPGEPCAAWVSLDEPRRAVASLVVPGDPPLLASLTQPAERLALLNEQRLLVVPLVCDPTRRGKKPLWVDETPLDNYGPSELLLRDVTGDGRLDLVAIGVQGRLRPHVRVEVHAGREDGRFEDHGERWLRERVDDAPWFFGAWRRDVDGDGVEDLAFADGRSLVMVPGRLDEDGAAALDWDGRLVADMPGEVVRVRAAHWLPPSGEGGVRVLMPARREGTSKDSPEEHRLALLTLRPAE
jgi:hypothetical protein